MNDNTHTHSTNDAHTHTVSNTVYPPYQTQPTVCPTCHRCPTCGAGGYSPYYQPYYPYSQPITTTSGCLPQAPGSYTVMLKADDNG